MSSSASWSLSYTPSRPPFSSRITLPGAKSFHAEIKSSTRFHCASFKLSMSVEIKLKLASPAISRTLSISSSEAMKAMSHYADGLADALGETEALGDSEGDPLALGLTEAEPDALGLPDALGDAEDDGDALGLAVVSVGDCQNPSASTAKYPPAGFRAIEPLP